MKEKIIAGCIIIGIIMTVFPPQKIQTFQILSSSQGNSMLIDEEIDYRFIGGGRDISSDFYEQTSISFDRLFLQYVIVTGVGMVIFLFRSKKEDD